MDVQTLNRKEGAPTVTSQSNDWLKYYIENEERLRSLGLVETLRFPIASISELYRAEPEKNLAEMVIVLYGTPVPVERTFPTAQGTLRHVETFGNRSMIPYDTEIYRETPIEKDLTHIFERRTHPVAEIFIGNGLYYRLVRVEQNDTTYNNQQRWYELRPLRFMGFELKPTDYEFYKAMFLENDLMTGKTDLKLSTSHQFKKRLINSQKRNFPGIEEGSSLTVTPIDEKRYNELVTTLERIVALDDFLIKLNAPLV